MKKWMVILILVVVLAGCGKKDELSSAESMMAEAKMQGVMESVVETEAEIVETLVEENVKEVAEEASEQDTEVKEQVVLATPVPTVNPTITPAPVSNNTGFGNSSVVTSPESTVAPTVQPTSAPEAQPTATPTTQPTAEPTVMPTPQPTPEPTASPTLDIATMTKEVYSGVNYWLYKPENATTNLPLVVYLHGGSGKGEDLELLTSVDGFPQYMKNGQLSCNAYVIFPQCPSEQKGWKTMGDSVEGIINYVCDTYGIDRNKISLTGHSMGGTGSWTFALDKSYLFYKVAPMSGSVTMSENNVQILSNMNIWAFVGDEDQIVSPDTSIEMIETLSEKGANANITIFEGANHFEVPSLGYLGTEVLSWLIS